VKFLAGATVVVVVVVEPTVGTDEEVQSLTAQSVARVSPSCHISAIDDSVQRYKN
jgi:hypothetical protein